MGVLGDGSRWCFCSGGAKLERIKGGIFATSSPALASIAGAGIGAGVGFLVHRNLLLTTHANLPSIAVAEAAEVRVCHGRLLGQLVPQRFFITSSILDLTIVGLDIMDDDSPSQVLQPQHLKACSSPSLELGNVVFLLGETEKKELTVGEGKVVIATDNLIKFSTEGFTWCPGSAGFDIQGNLAFMVCDPMKLASSPTARSSTSSSSSLSWKKDAPMQFGIPIPVIFDWLYQHWEGSLDEVSKPKLPLTRLISTGRTSDNSSTSFTQRRIFKDTEENDDASSSEVVQQSKYRTGSSSVLNAKLSQDNKNVANMRCPQEQGIPTPEIFESPKLTSDPVSKKQNAPVQLLDINFPPQASSTIVLPLPLKQLLADDSKVQGTPHVTQLRNVSREVNCDNYVQEYKLPPIGTWKDDRRSEMQSSSPPSEYESERYNSGPETLYSAETMESRNIPSPRESNIQQVGRSQSCVNYKRWSSSQRSSAPCKAALQKQRTFVPIRKSNSQTSTLPHKSHDYCSPTVSSSMKKRNSDEQPMRPRQTAGPTSPKWIF